MEDLPRRPRSPHGQPGRPAPPRNPGRVPRAGSGNPAQRRPARPNSPVPPPGPGRSAGRRNAIAEEELANDPWERRKQRRAHAIWHNAGRTVVALLSVIVLSATGFAWASLKGFSGSTTAGDVIGDLSAEDGAVDILLVGNDSRTDAQGNPLPDEVLRELRTTDDEGGDLTDTMILVRIPNNGKRAAAVSFPRDTLVDLDEFGEVKLNSALGRAKHAEEQRLRNAGVTDEKEIEQKSRAAGQRYLVNTIEDLSGAEVDHYAEVNLLGFYQITKAIGGVDVCLKNPVDDSAYSGAVFPAGRQTIEGADALAFVRQRHGLPRGDLDRAVRQQVFMSGLARKMLSSGTLANPNKLSKLVDAIQDSIVLDPRLANNIMGFAQKLQGVAGGNIEFHTIPVRLEGPSGQEDVVADKAEVHRFVANLLLPPEERAKKEQEQKRLEAAREQVTVSVYNGTGISGLANRVLESLSAEGFTPGGTGNSDSTSESLVYHAEGDEASGKLVSDALGGVPTAPSPNLSSGQVEVHLGSDYQGPGAQTFAANPQVQLDGMAQVGPLPVQMGEEEEQVITAGGVPCVN